MAMLIPLTLTVPGTGEVLCPALLADGAHLVLVDCGYPDSLPLIEAAMAELGLSPAELTEVFITHHDDDHMGGLARLCARYPRIRVVAGAEEAPYLTGARKSLRLCQAEALQPTLSPEARAWGEAFWGSIPRMSCFSWPMRGIWGRSICALEICSRARRP